MRVSSLFDVHTWIQTSQHEKIKKHFVELNQDHFLTDGWNHFVLKAEAVTSRQPFKCHWMMHCSEDTGKNILCLQFYEIVCVLGPDTDLSLLTHAPVELTGHCKSVDFPLPGLTRERSCLLTCIQSWNHHWAEKEPILLIVLGNRYCHTIVKGKGKTEVNILYITIGCLKTNQ